MWIGLRLRRDVRKPISAATMLFAAIVVGTLPELLQIPVGSRTASATDALFGIIGAYIGIRVAIWFYGDFGGANNLQTTGWIHDPAFWFVSSILCSGLLCVAAWWPFNFITDLDEIADRLRASFDDPFGDRGGSDLRTLFRFFRLALMSAPLGAMVGVGVERIANGQLKHVIATVAVATLLAFCVLLEFGQVLEESRSGGGVGAVVRGFATGIGFLLARAVVGRSASRWMLPKDDPIDSLRSTPGSRTQASKHPKSEGTDSSDEYIPGLNGLRALACLAVFGVHWQQLTRFDFAVGPFDVRQLLENGNTGVAVFLVLTGFLLSTRLWSQHDADRPGEALRGYWRHRAVRILPTYWLCLALVFVGAGYWRSIGGWFDTLLHAFFSAQRFCKDTLQHEFALLGDCRDRAVLRSVLLGIGHFAFDRLAIRLVDCDRCRRRRHDL